MKVFQLQSNYLWIYHEGDEIKEDGQISWKKRKHTRISEENSGEKRALGRRKPRLRNDTWVNVTWEVVACILVGGRKWWPALQYNNEF